jgi:hypothetical protein
MNNMDERLSVNTTAAATLRLATFVAVDTINIVKSFSGRKLLGVAEIVQILKKLIPLFELGRDAHWFFSSSNKVFTEALRVLIQDYGPAHRSIGYPHNKFSVGGSIDDNILLASSVEAHKHRMKIAIISNDKFINELYRCSYIQFCTENSGGTHIRMIQYEPPELYDCLDKCGRLTISRNAVVCM